MARPKNTKNKTAVKKHVFKDPTIEEIVEVEVEFNCPVRGKIKQKVKMKRLKKVKTDNRVFVGASDLFDSLDKEDDIAAFTSDPEE